jgi:hypothetical protein
MLVTTLSRKSGYVRLRRLSELQVISSRPRAASMLRGLMHNDTERGMTWGWLNERLCDLLGQRPYEGKVADYILHNSD